MKQKFFDLCCRVWAEIVLCFDEYSKMKKRQVMMIVEADDAGNENEVIVISEKL